jgi:hypothetical protein
MGKSDTKPNMKISWGSGYKNETKHCKPMSTALNAINKIVEGINMD